ncbi:MAG TPA: sigma-70 family RNA polymerase sigma factor [Solirubrobacterales bacterium]|nr:sigma-70 family RNA polymerase sigma factor [Solirubrobacterales bacterium]
MSRAAAAWGLRAGSAATRALSDDSLALRAIAGDEEAFAAIFARHHQALSRYCLALLGDPQDAQDALQNTMIKVMRAMPGEQRRIALKPWLYRIAHNESVELRRRRRETRSLDPDLAEVGSSLAETAAARERLRVLIADLDKLPERQRGALIMRELAGFDFAEIGIALGTSAAVARQTLYEARLSLRQMDEGREMSCERVARALSDGDGRVARRRDLRSHLRTCASCRDLSEAIERREREFAALAPLPAAAAADLLQSVLDGHGAAGGSAVTMLGGGAVKSLGASVALKGVATAAVVAAIGVGAADRGGLIDLGSPGGRRPQATQAEQSPAAGSSVAKTTRPGAVAGHRTTGFVAGGKEAPGGVSIQATKPLAAAKPTGAGTAAENANPIEPTGADAGPSPTSSPTIQGASDAADAPGSNPEGNGHEKQLPAAAEHGQQTAASHKTPNHGQETAANHKATNHGQETAESHKAHGNEAESHPAQPSNPSAEEEPSSPPASPAVPESNGNAKGKGNGRGNSPAADDEESSAARNPS